MSSVFLPPEQTRLVTICAHVDHGKTTLADNLIESNGIISERLAGTLRYLDSLEEEQRRGITMRASAIGLRHKHRSKPKDPPVDIIVHLLDSPGHTDFSTEVSSSLQCCDGCLLVVDAVEGMCARTHQVVREAQAHQLIPILVINKVDRLCTDLCLTPTEAYLRLRSLIETVNATCSAMLVSKQAHDENHDEEQEEWTFDPAKGNVIFASALYGWGFTVPLLSRSLFRQKALPIKAMVLKQYLFGDFKFKDGKVLKWKQESSDMPLFAEYALQNIWEIYEGVASAAATCGQGSSLFSDGRIVNPAKTSDQAKIQASTPGMDQVLGMMLTGSTSSSNNSISTTEDIQTILTRTGVSTEDAVLRSLLRRYRPLSDVVLDAVYEVCPSPATASLNVRPRALALSTDEAAEADDQFLEFQKQVKSCDTSANVPTVAHICKFMATDRAHIRDPELDDSQSSIIMGLARVLSGSLKTGNDYYVMGPKHKYQAAAPQRKIRLYLLMGSTFVLVNEVPAGHLCAIQNLEDVQLKTATICDVPHGMPLQGFDHGIRPLVKVNVESVDAADTYLLERGLIKLSLADAAVEVTATAKGERILACLGEIHLEQSILDLKNIYCGKDLALRISEPIVEFGETTDWFENELDFTTFFDTQADPVRQCTIPPYNEEEGLDSAYRGRSRAVISGRLAAISLRAIPLHRMIYSSMKEKRAVDGSETELLCLGRALGLIQEKELTAEGVLDALLESLCSIDESGNAIVESRTLTSGLSVRGVASENGEVYTAQKQTEVANSTDSVEENFGDDAASSEEGHSEFESVRECIGKNGFSADGSLVESGPADVGALEIWNTQMKGSVVAGFRMAMSAGSICEEPVRSVLVILEGVEIAVKENATSEFKCAKPLSGGMVVASLRSGIRCALLTRPSRLMESHLRLTLHSSLGGIGSLYSVLSKRRGKVLEDSMVDGTDLLSISATLPHAESFGLAPELFRKSSGEVTAPELVFSHWERFDEDPFWIPTSLEEREDFGEILNNGDVSTGIDNTALKYIRKVRERKGLLVDSSRTVIAAEKQRTLKR